MGEDNRAQEWEAVKNLKALLRAGLELGVPEAVRKSNQFGPLLTGPDDDSPADTIGEALANFIQNVKTDPQSMLQVAKEVWSRGGKKEKERAASAVGRGLGVLVPHRALQAAKELAAMARDGREADLVGREAIEPILEKAPAMLDRVKQLLQDNQRLIRIAAIQGLVAYVGRKRKVAALGAELILLIAEEHEKEIRDAVRIGIGKLMEIDPKATAAAVAAWVKSSPTSERVQAGAGFLKQKVAGASKAAGRAVTGAVGKIANGAKKAANGASRPKARTKSPARRPVKR